MKICKVNGCTELSRTNNMCSKHYARDKRLGTTDESALTRGKYGEGYIDQNGYKRIGGIAVHRIVMEQYLGRKLLPTENVHHINGVRDDNRIDNLELWIKTQPCGQRSQDLVKWSKEILATYDKQEEYDSDSILEIKVKDQKPEDYDCWH